MIITCMKCSRLKWQACKHQEMSLNPSCLSQKLMPLEIEDTCEPCLSRDERLPSKMVQLHLSGESRSEATTRVYPHARRNGASSPLVRTVVFKNQYHSHHYRNKTDRTKQTKHSVAKTWAFWIVNCAGLPTFHIDVGVKNPDTVLHTVKPKSLSLFQVQRSMVTIGNVVTKAQSSQKGFWL